MTAHYCITVVSSIFSNWTQSFDMKPRPRPAWSYQSAPPRSYLLALSVPHTEAPPPPQQNILIKEAAGDDLNSTLEYAIKAAKFPEVTSNAVVLVDAAVHTRTRPPLPLLQTQSGLCALQASSRRSLAPGTSSLSLRHPKGHCPRRLCLLH